MGCRSRTRSAGCSGKAAERSGHAAGAPARTLQAPRDMAAGLWLLFWLLLWLLLWLLFRPLLGPFPVTVHRARAPRHQLRSHHHRCSC